MNRASTVTEEDLAAANAAVDAGPPMSDEALDRVAALWAAMDAQAQDARRRAAAHGTRDR
jgi:hypothetical protein